MMRPKHREEEWLINNHMTCQCTVQHTLYISTSTSFVRPWWSPSVTNRSDWKVIRGWKSFAFILLSFNRNQFYEYQIYKDDGTRKSVAFFWNSLLLVWLLGSTVSLATPVSTYLDFDFVRSPDQILARGCSPDKRQSIKVWILNPTLKIDVLPRPFETQKYP